MKKIIYTRLLLLLFASMTYAFLNAQCPIPCDTYLSPILYWQEDECTYNFAVESSVDCGETTVELIWNFGDGNISSPDAGFVVQHSYSEDDVYNVSIIVTYTNINYPGCSVTLTRNITVAVNGCNTCGCNLQLGEIALTEVNNCTYEFSADYDYSCGIYDGDPEYLWDFGDGNTSTDIHAAHTYDCDGVYNVKLIAQIIDPNNLTCFSKATKSVEVEVSDCDSCTVCDCEIRTQGIVALQDDNCTYSFFAPINYSCGTATGASGFDWDFGDGNTSTTFSPIHTYEEDGVYQVSVKVSIVDPDNPNCMACANATKWVVVEGCDLINDMESSTEHVFSEPGVRQNGSYSIVRYFNDSDSTEKPSYFARAKDGSGSFFSRKSHEDTGLDEEQFLSAIYPNPASDEVTVLIKGKDQDNLLLQIVDIQGRKHVDRIVEGGSQIKLDISALEEGVYHIILSSEKKMLGSSMFLKQD